MEEKNRLINEFQFVDYYLSNLALESGLRYKKTRELKISNYTKENEKKKGPTGALGMV